VLPKEIEKLSPNTTDEEWRTMFHAEQDYFESLKTPSPENTFAMLYVKRLRVLAEKQYVVLLLLTSGYIV
jgi:hypothetical protein